MIRVHVQPFSDICRRTRSAFGIAAAVAAAPAKPPAQNLQALRQPAGSRCPERYPPFAVSHAQSSAAAAGACRRRNRSGAMRASGMRAAGRRRHAWPRCSF